MRRSPSTPRSLDRAPAERLGFVRVNGMLVLVAIVVVGIVTGAGLYRSFRGASDARLRAELALVPDTPEGRLDEWLRQSAPLVHHRLAVVGRFSPEYPWLVTHAVEDGEPPQLWGVVCAEVPRDLASRDGMTVVLRLPEPRPLGRVSLAPEQRRRVPHLEPGASPDTRSLLEVLALHLLEDVPAALEKDVPGARIEVRTTGP